MKHYTFDKTARKLANEVATAIVGTATWSVSVTDDEPAQGLKALAFEELVESSYKTRQFWGWAKI